MRSPYDFADRPAGYLIGNLSPFMASKAVNDVTNLVSSLPPGQTTALQPQQFSKPAEATPIVDQAKYALFTTIPINIGVASVLILPRPPTQRLFLFIINTSPVNQIIVNFGNQATPLLGIPVAANLGFVGFDSVVPQNDIYVIGSGAGTTGTLIYANSTVG